MLSEQRSIEKFHNADKALIGNALMRRKQRSIQKFRNVETKTIFIGKFPDAGKRKSIRPTYQCGEKQEN